MTLALDCETDPSPFAMHLFHRGQRFLAEIIEQNDPDIYTLHTPAHLRAELPVPGSNPG